MRNHLPVDAVAHRTIPFTLGLSNMPAINSHLVFPTRILPPQSLMDSTYSALKKRVGEKLLVEWSSLFPTPGYYRPPPALSPRPFIGLSKFIAGRIHQMTAGKSYLAAHPTWRSPYADTSCPGCGLEPETVEHAVLSCPSRQHSRSRLLHGVTDVGPEAPLWSSLPLLKRLATFMGVTSTGFPPTMFLPTTPPSSPPFSRSPPRVPPPVFRVFRWLRYRAAGLFFPLSYVGFPFSTTKLLVCAFLVKCGLRPGGRETCALVDIYWCRDFLLLFVFDL